VLSELTYKRFRIWDHLFGRRLYELMAVWETDPAAAAQSPAAREFAQIWQAADKVVYSRTLAGLHDQDADRNDDVLHGWIERAKGPRRVEILIGVFLGRPAPSSLRRTLEEGSHDAPVHCRRAGPSASGRAPG
jgi:hypothetical protein